MILKKYFNNPGLIFIKLDRIGIRLLSDEKFVKIMYKKFFNKELNLDEPKTFNEKLQWLKLNDRKDIYTTMVDKYDVKEYVANIIGKEYIIPTLGIYDKFGDIDFNVLPKRFVIKCTHDSGSVIVVKDKNNLNIKEIRKKINKSLRKNFYYRYREWPYKNIKPRIIIEKYMEDESKKELKDYKIFCFNGNPELIMVDTDRFLEHKRNVYDIDWNKIKLNINFPNNDEMIIKRPHNLNILLELSKKLSNDIPFIRTDFYIINDRIYFGELTFFPGSGFQKITPEFWQFKLGKMIDISKVKYNEK